MVGSMRLPFLVARNQSNESLAGKVCTIFIGNWRVPPSRPIPPIPPPQTNDGSSRNSTAAESDHNDNTDQTGEKQQNDDQNDGDGEEETSKHPEPANIDNLDEIPDSNDFIDDPPEPSAEGSNAADSKEGISPLLPTPVFHNSKGPFLRMQPHQMGNFNPQGLLHSHTLTSLFRKFVCVLWFVC